MAFKSVFIATLIATALIVAAFLIHNARPMRQTDHPSAQYVRATGKCAECHRRETGAVVHQFSLSKHAKQGLSCIECHRPVPGQVEHEHHGFKLNKRVTALNCKQCHSTEYDQFLRSRHAAPAWAAVSGREAFTPEQIKFAETYHPGAVDRDANKLALLEGPGAITKGCASCHEVGKPNLDGSIGSCTHCHSRHNTSIALARSPQVCGQCHMGPDHSQLEIYNESKHGVLFHAQRGTIDLEAPSKTLTTRQMPIPTCATCHMSGLEGMKVTHDTTDRLSYWLFAANSKKRPHYDRAQAEMKELCLKCHAKTGIDRFYKEAEVVVDSTNRKVNEAKAIMEGLRAKKLLTPEPFDEPIEFLYFDLWHYFGRTAKHGAFMGGADFVQWHGNYELLLKMTELKEKAKQLEAEAKHAAPNK
jgi:hydroxylamine dehydrogenase